MIRNACLIAALATAGTLSLFGAEKTPPPTSLTTFGAVVDVNVVNVDVYATDKSGKRVNDLRQGDFELLEDGKPVPISNFTPVRLPVSGSQPGSPQAPGTPAGPEDRTATGTPADGWNLVVYVDNANIRPSHRTRALQQLREFLATSVSPADRVMVVASDRVLKVWQPFTSDASALGTALQGIEKVSAQGPEIDLDRRNAFTSMMDIQKLALADPVDPIPCPLDIARPAHDFAAWMNPNGWPFIIGEAVLIFAFTFFYVAVIFNSIEQADNLKKYGGFIPGVRPGRPTAEYLDRILARLTFPGALYLAAVAGLPTIIIASTGASRSFYFGGTSC